MAQDDNRDAPEDAPALEASVSDEIMHLDLDTELVELSIPKRQIGLRVVPYNVVAHHPSYGALMFEPGAFGSIEPRDVRLRMDHEDPPTGIGINVTDRPDALFMGFQLSKTQRADEQLTLAKDGVSRGTSPGYAELIGRPKVRHINGENVKVYPPGSVVLRELSTTWIPTFEGDGVAYMLHKQQEAGGAAQMAESTEHAPAVGAQITQIIDYDRLAQSTAGAIGLALAKEREAGAESKIESLLTKFDEMVELQRANFKVPQGETRKPLLRDWVQITLRRMRGESIPPTVIKELALDDVVTTEQPGLVPTVFTPDYDDLINQDRPFLRSTRQIAPPSSGTSMVLPIITTRAVAGTQASSLEKGELTTTATKVGTATFAYQAVFGGADISIQFINRAEASFFDLLTGDMGMAYALDCDSKGITSLLTQWTDSASATHVPVDGGVLDPEDLSLGAAWKTSISVYKRGPDTIWLSSTAVAAFIDAKAPLTNAPLYSNLAGNFTAGTGTGGTISGLRPIYVPALDTSAVDVIVGPSRGFVWSEDPARTLQADVPSNAGRDIALVGGIFPGPRYSDAYTTFTVAS